MKSTFFNICKGAYLLGVLIWIFNSDLSFAKNSLESKIAKPVNGSKHIDFEYERPKIFSKHYYGLGLGKNFPEGKSRRLFKPGFYQPIIYYKYSLLDSWMMGMSAQFKVLKKKEDNQTSGILSIAQQSMYIVRLYHPTYLQFGAKILYLLPARRAGFPVQRDPKFTIEVGVSGSIILSTIVFDRAILNVFVDIWRGTKTSRFQAIESGLSIDFAFN